MKISCIIAAYNEEARIAGVLKAVAGHPLLDEVIVVNDGSKDKTSEVAQGFDIKLIDLESNRGKSFAIATGIRAAKNDLLMFLDADLVGLTADGITALAQPVLDSSADISISLRKNSLLIYKMIGLDFVSGERVFSKDLLADQIDAIEKLPGFGLEVFINRLIIQKKLRMKVVYLKTLVSPRKSAKTSYFEGQKADFKMIMQILKVIGLYDILLQNWRMIKLKV